MPEARTERSEIGAIRRLGREPDDGARTSVEVAACHCDLGAVSGDAPDAIAPATRSLDRGFNRFTASARRQDARGRAQIGHFDQAGQEWSQFGGVIRARGNGHALRLVDQRVDQSRMRMAMADRRISRHEVEIALAVRVPQPGAVAAFDYDRNRRVVRRCEVLFHQDGGGRSITELPEPCIHSITPSGAASVGRLAPVRCESRTAELTDAAVGRTHYRRIGGDARSGQRIAAERFDRLKLGLRADLLDAQRRIVGPRVGELAVVIEVAACKSQHVVALA